MNEPRRSAEQVGDPLPEGIRVAPGFLGAEAAAALRSRCEQACDFRVLRWRAFGREGPLPRETAFFAPRGACYAYSGVRHVGSGVPPFLAALCERVAQDAGTRFDSVLVTRYRDGSDCVGWHSDDEPELGAQPALAILSLGASARIRFRARSPVGRRGSASRVLADGDLLHMAPGVQEAWQHAVPRVASRGVRISLGFRCLGGPVGDGAHGAGR